MMKGYKNLEEYGVIGNLQTCALVGRDGSIDWLCFPYLESPSVMAALLDAERGGHFRIEPVTKYYSRQSYAGNTNILQTTFSTPLGDAVITDFMPVEEIAGRASVGAVFRKVECLKGMVKMSVSVKPRFDYGTAIPEAEPTDGGVVFRRQDDLLYFQSPVPVFLHDAVADGSFGLKENESVWFSLRYNNLDRGMPSDYEKILNRVRDYWLGWVHTCESGKCVFEEPWHPLAIRSALVLKLLSNPDSGAIAAAATTSLPEKIGGSRNWDYRYAWIRDASFTDQALYHMGHVTEARDFRNWLIGIVEKAGDPSRINIMYPLHDGEKLEEKVLEHLSGYDSSKPVRVGNAAAEQKQLDIFGEMMNAIYDTSRRGEEISEKRWAVFSNIVDYACKVWDTKDSGIWEVRGEPRHFVYSKLMCWVAVDRGLKIAREKGFAAPLQTWKETRNEIKQAILERGYSKSLESFVQSFGSNVLDATGLLIAPMGLLPHNDPRISGTIDAVLKNLTTEEGLVYRYRGDDGLPAGEGCFILCSFWLIKALALSGRTEEAEKIFTKVCGYISPLGLLSEEIDPGSGRLIGNFPQAFSHVGVINSALYLGISKGRKYEGPEPLGMYRTDEEEERE
jgi:GH15 family glucan-1,4-alpha-glucosidase